MRLQRTLVAAFILTTAILACTNPVDIPAEPPNVETIVAATFAALTASAPETSVTPPPSSSALLPHSLYFLNNDKTGLIQIFRLAKDGKTVVQLTFEPANVGEFDPSPVDGSLVYVSNNQLLLVKADGSNRRILLDGGTVDPNNAFLNNITKPVWSPDGETIAFGYQGLNFYAVSTGESNRVLDNLLDDLGNGLTIPHELYWPDKYSSDGSKLLITLGYYEGASSAVYGPSTNTLIRLKGGEGALICCGEPNWSPDNNSLFAGNASLGMFSPGLWKVDATTGQVTTVLTGDTGNGTFNFADEPILAPDGKLYYFFANQPADNEVVTRVPLQIVRSEPDGVTGRTPIRPETFNLMNEALWAPDASFVIVANAPIEDVHEGGVAELYYIDGQKPPVHLVDFAMNMKWGP